LQIRFATGIFFIDDYSAYNIIRCTPK